MTTPDDNTPRLLFLIDVLSRFKVSHYVAAEIEVSGSVNSISKIPLQSQKTVAINFLLVKVCLNVLGLLGSSVCASIVLIVPLFPD